MTLQAQRGNVTLITALTALLMVMVVVLAAGIGNTASEATRAQAASDEAAVTAATTYIAVTNDETIFDLIDWALGFIQRLADMVEYIGSALAAVVIIPPVAAIGDALEIIGSTISSIVGSIQDAFQSFKDGIQQVLDEAKNILAVINATIIAANNGYLGFVLPKGVLQASGRSKYTLKDIEKLRDQYEKLATDDTLVNQIEHQALEGVWQTGIDPAQKEPRQGIGPGASQSRDVFHIWTDDTPGCVGAVPKWSRPCKEIDFLRATVEKPYTSAMTGIDELVKTLNFDKKSGPDPLIDPASDADKAKQALDDAKTALQKGLTDKIDGTFMSGLGQWDNGAIDPTLGTLCPGGSEHSGPYTNFHCAGDVPYFSVPTLNPDACNGPGPDPKNPLAHCQRFWDFNPTKTQDSFRAGSLPSDYIYIEDYRNTQHWKDFINQAVALKKWKSDLNKIGPSVHPAEASGDAEEAFIMIDRVQPSQMSILASKLSGQTAPDHKWTITASIAKIYHPKSQLPDHSEIDTIKVNDLCINVFNPSQTEIDNGGEFDPFLHVVPWDAYSWCHFILGAFDLFISFYDTIHDFFYNCCINPIENEPQIHIPWPIDADICLFCWVGDLLKDALDALLGPPHPDNRTYHVALVPVNCVPAVATIAEVANGVKSLIDVVKEIEGKALGGGDPNADNGSCNTGSDPSGNTDTPTSSGGG